MLCRARLILCALFGVLVYISVHEGGHALAAMSTGRTVTDVRILSFKPHISLRGQSTPAKDAFAAAAGSGLVVVLWFGYTAARRDRPITWVSEGFTFFTSIEMLAWFVSSAAHTIAPPQNDVTKFIELSGFHPAMVALAVAALAICALRVKTGNLGFSEAEPAVLSC